MLSHMPPAKPLRLEAASFVISVTSVSLFTQIVGEVAIICSAVKSMQRLWAEFIPTFLNV